MLLLLACFTAADTRAQAEDFGWKVSLRGGAAVDGEELFRGIQFGWWRRLGGETWWAGLRYAQYRATSSDEEFRNVAVYSAARTMQLSIRARFPKGKWTPFASLGGGAAGGDWGDGGVVQADVGVDYAVTSQFDASIQLSAGRAPGPWAAGLLVGAVVSF
ncbi:MAG: hypothetical protein WD021_06345 [Rhodothermales bacterium]